MGVKFYQKKKKKLYLVILNYEHFEESYFQSSQTRAAVSIQRLFNELCSDPTLSLKHVNTASSLLSPLLSGSECYQQQLGHTHRAAHWHCALQFSGEPGPAPRASTVQLWAITAVYLKRQDGQCSQSQFHKITFEIYKVAERTDLIFSNVLTHQL